MSVVEQEVTAIQEKPMALPAIQMINMIERLVMDEKVDVEKLERVVAVQERMMDRDAEQAFNAALVKAQHDMPNIQANSANQQTNSMYAKLDKINQMIAPVYTRHGFSISFNTAPSSIEGWVQVTAILSHEQGHSREYHYDLPMDDSGIAGKKNKTDVHARASSITYGQRYLVTLIFNLAIGNDADGNQPQDTITEEQHADLVALLEEVGGDKTAFCKVCKVDDLKNLPASKFDGAIKKLEAKRNANS